MSKFNLSLLDEAAFGITFGRLTAEEFKDLLDRIRGFPERRFFKEHKLWRIPTTIPNIAYLLSHFDEDEYEVDPEARVVLEYSSLSEQRHEKKQTHRWNYIFEGTVPEVDYDESLTKPYKHQTVALDALHNTEFFGLLMEMGTGKTKVVVDECFWQAKTRMGDPPFKVLVVCPKTIQGVWLREFDKHRNPNVSYFIEKVFTQHRGMQTLIDGAKAQVPLKVFVISYDSVKAMLQPLSMYNFDLCVLDESTRIKNPKAQRTKALLSLRDSCKRRVILTGAPVVNNVLDLWAQFEFLQPACLGYEDYNRFRDRYAHFTRSEGGYVKVHGAKKLNELKERMAKYSFIVTKDQCLDLPPKDYATREVEMSPDQRLVYEQMVEQAVAELEGAQLVARFVIVQLLRLSQICSGFMNTEQGLRPIPGADTKLKELDSIFDEIGWHSKLLIWARFQYDIERIEAHLRKKGLKVATLYGKTKDADRDTIEERFNSDGLQVIVGEPGTGGLGLTLIGTKENRCHTVVYYSNDYALEKRIQSEDRSHRIGQDLPVTYVDICCENSIDERIVRILQGKKDLSNYVKDMTSIRELLLG